MGRQTSTGGGLLQCLLHNPGPWGRFKVANSPKEPTIPPCIIGFPSLPPSFSPSARGYFSSRNPLPPRRSSPSPGRTRPAILRLILRCASGPCPMACVTPSARMPNLRDAFRCACISMPARSRKPRTSAASHTSSSTWSSMAARTFPMSRTCSVACSVWVSRSVPTPMPTPPSTRPSTCSIFPISRQTPSSSASM